MSWQHLVIDFERLVDTGNHPDCMKSLRQSLGAEHFLDTPSPTVFEFQRKRRLLSLSNSSRLNEKTLFFGGGWLRRLFSTAQ